MCRYCNGRKTMPTFSWYDGKLTGSRKCICNGGAWYPEEFFAKSTEQINAGEHLSDTKPKHSEPAD